MNVSSPQIVFAETPDEISLSFCVYGCPFKCKGCHSPELRDPNKGFTLRLQDYREYLNKYKNYISCVLFMGGEFLSEIKVFLREAKNHGLKTCLYTGCDNINHPAIRRLYPFLDYIKYGSFQKKYGGLESPRTNQKYLDLKNKRDLTYKFYERNI